MRLRVGNTRPLPRRLLTSLALALLTVHLGAGPAQAQVAALVFDPTHYTVNTLTSIQSVITAVESVAQTANMVLELTPLGDIVAAQGIAADLAQVSALAQDAEGLMRDVSALQAQIPALFDTTSLPRTPVEITQRYGAMQDAVRRARMYAVRTQTLVSTVVRAADHLTTLAACVRLGRPCIGVELDPAYFAVACDRLQQEVDDTRQSRLFPLAQAAD